MINGLLGSGAEELEVEEDIEKLKVKKTKDRDSVMDFLKKVLAPSLTKIEKSLTNILDVMTQQSELKEKSQEKTRVTGEKEKKRDREEKSEESALSKFGKGLKDKVTKPLTGFFDMLMKFFMNILAGALVLKALDILKDPKKFFADLVNPVIEFFNGVIKFVWDGLLLPLNWTIDRINEGLNDINNVLFGVSKLLGSQEEKSDAFKIDTFEAPQIPLIEVPSVSEEKPAEGMTGGGQVNTNTGEKITGMGRDTQMVALEPGEVVMSNKAGDFYGRDTLLGMNADAGGTNKPTQGKVLGFSGGGIVEHLHGDPSRSGYRSDHGSVSNAHDHFAFSSEALRKAVQDGLANGDGPSGRKYDIGSTTGGKHADQSYHYVGKAFDIPWSQFGSGAISQKDYDQSAILLKDVQSLVKKNGGSTKDTSSTPVEPQSSKVPQQSSRKPIRWDYPLTMEGGRRYVEDYDKWKKGGGTPSSSSKPQTPMVPGKSGGGSSGGWKPVLELIAKHEAVGGSYDSIYPSSKKDGLSQMTIAQADAWQASTASSRGSAAAGRYQFMYIKDQAADAGIGPDEMFSPENQDKMAISLIEKKRGVTLDMMKSNPDEAMIRLGMEWASLPMPKDMQGGSRSVKAGQSYYAGDGRNKAGATIAEVRKAMGAVGSVTPSVSSPSSSSGGMGGQRPEDVPPSVSSPSSGSPMISSGNRTNTPGPPSCVCPPKAPKIVAPPSSPQSQGGSAAVGNQSKRDGFSPIDLGNPDLLVVKSIYNIVG